MPPIVILELNLSDISKKIPKRILPFKK